MGLQLIKSNYFYKGKDGFDKVMLITKNEKGEKDFTIVQKPTLEYYVSNEKADPETEYRSIPLDMVEKRRCYYKDLYSDMVNAVNDPDLTEYYKSVISNPVKGINDKLRKIHLDYRFHGSDVNIEDYYIGKFLDKHPTEKNDYGVTKFFYDIEVDGSSITGFPEAELAEVPINIISACMDMGDHINFYMLALHYTEEENPSYHEFFNDLVNRVTPIKKEMSEKAGKEVKFIIKRFRNEINLIKEFFNIINDLRPDFVLGWNSHRFDFPYIYNRTSLLIAGTDETIEDIMCPRELPYKKVSYKIDRHKQDACDNASTVNVASYSVHIDQMNLYANLRKGKGQLEKYELDYIAEIELNEHKEELETNIKTQHFDNYTNFFKYSAQDTLLLYLIEKKVEDIEMLYVISMITETRPEQCLKKTVCLRNLASKFYLKNGRAISNNRSSLKQKTGKPRGAFVARTEIVNKIGMQLFLGAELSQYLFEEVCDLDLSSLYPSIIITLNLAPETFICKINIKKVTELDGSQLTMDINDINIVGNVTDKNELSKIKVKNINDAYTLANNLYLWNGVMWETKLIETIEDQLIDKYISKDYVSVGHEYLGLPSMDNLINAVKVGA